MDKGWKIYRHALIPTTPPHIEPDLKILENKSIWKKGVFFARYTTDFDCGYETNWWYCILDRPFDIKQVSAKKRYEINRGLKNVEVKKINTADYAEQLADIMEKCYNEYSKSYRPKINKEEWINNFYRNLYTPSNIDYWGIFLRDNMKLCGFASCELGEENVNLNSVKIDPCYIKTGANAALVYTIIQEYVNSNRFRYISDGEKTIIHKSNYQEYLIKYFMFRKAYCKLHIIYRPITKIIVTILYPFRGLFNKLDKIFMFQNINAVLKMESIRREF